MKVLMISKWVILVIILAIAVLSLSLIYTQNNNTPSEEKQIEIILPEE